MALDFNDKLRLTNDLLRKLGHVAHCAARAERQLKTLLESCYELLEERVPPEQTDGALADVTCTAAGIDADALRDLAEAIEELRRSRARALRELGC